MLEVKIKELEQKIKMCESEYNNFLKSAEPIKEDCVNAIIDEMKKFCKTRIENKVKTEVKITNALGIDNLKKLKNSMNEILEQMDSKKEDLINNKNIWIINENWFNSLDFKNSDLFGVRYNNQKTISNNISNAMRNLTINIGSLLNEYGYINTKEQNEWKIENGNIIYAYSLGVGFKTVLEEKQKEYTDLFQKTFDKFEELYKLRKEFEETNALYLWEQA